jgi:hypothetical protein
MIRNRSRIKSLTGSELLKNDAALRHSSTRCSKMPEYRNAGEKVSPASLVLPLVPLIYPHRPSVIDVSLVPLITNYSGSVHSYGIYWQRAASICFHHAAPL